MNEVMREPFIQVLEEVLGNLKKGQDPSPLVIFGISLLAGFKSADPTDLIEHKAANLMRAVLVYMKGDLTLPALVCRVGELEDELRTGIGDAALSILAPSIIIHKYNEELEEAAPYMLKLTKLARQFIIRTSDTKAQEEQEIVDRSIAILFDNSKDVDPNNPIQGE